LETRRFAGFTKAQLRAEPGEPHAIRARRKNTAHIWGPVEALWDRIEVGGRMQVWTHSPPAGRKELYFLGTSNDVAGEFFWYDDPARNPVFEGRAPSGAGGRRACRDNLERV
jgi:hypothetical protein